MHSCTQTEHTETEDTLKLKVSLNFKAGFWHGLHNNICITIHTSQYNTDITKINIVIYCCIDFLAQPYRGNGPSFVESTMLHCHVSTVAQKGPTLKQMVLAFLQVF